MFSTASLPKNKKTSHLNSIFFLSLFGLGIAGAAAGQDSTIPDYNLNLEIPVVDYPFNFENSHSFPSMQQSLALTKDIYELTHYGLGRLIGDPDQMDRGWPRFMAAIGFAITDTVMLKLPFGNSWLHEEWHRAAMAHRGISSHNDVYDMKGGNIIAVSHLEDADLERLKRDYPAEHIRKDAAGMESEHELAAALERDHFLHGTHTFDKIQLYINKLSPISYLQTCAYSSSVSSTEDQNKNDGADVAKRDFTGLDCNGWAYDIFRPDEPYSARGIHPSGVGVNRYRSVNDLTPSQQDYLILQSRLSWLNMIDPFVLGLDRFRGNLIGLPPQSSWNFNLRHDLTSFGSVVDTNFYYSDSNGAFIGTMHHYANHDRYFPGLEASMWPVDCPDMMIRVALWDQPLEQRFFTRASVPGGLLGGRWTYLRSSIVDSFVEALGKSDGWVTGEVSLRPQFSVRLGLSKLAF